MKLPSSKLDIKLLAFDLDDTLLNDDHFISERNVKALQKAAEKGIYVVLCSGRAENGILPFVRQLNIAGTEAGRYLIAFNGASIFDLHQRKVIYSNSVDPEVLKFVYREARKRDMPSVVYDPETIYSWIDSDWARMDAKLCNLKFKKIDNFEDFISKGAPKMLVPSEPEKVMAFKDFLCENLRDKADICISKPFFLEILTHGVGKGPSILKLAEIIGISREQTIAFGDSMNDESMLSDCGYGVAMLNGLPYIQEISDFVTRKDNNNDGIADFLEEFVL